MSNSFKKSNIKKSKFKENGTFLTIPPQRKRRRTIRMESENTKKQKEEIKKQNEIKNKIEELDKRIKLEFEQYMKVISSKKEELYKTEERIKQIKEKNANLKISIENVEKQIELKLNKIKNMKNLGKINNEKKEENPVEIKLKENKNIVENTRKTMEKYKKDIDKLENTIWEDENIIEINKLKYEIKSAKERIITLEQEKKYLLIINEEHNKCIESESNIKKDIDKYTLELNKLKFERNKEIKEKQEKYSKEMAIINKNKPKINEALLSPDEIKSIKERKIKKIMNDFLVSNKAKLLKYSLSDNNIDTNDNANRKKQKIQKTDIITLNKLNNINNKFNKKELYKKKKNYSENINNFNLDIDTNEDIPLTPLFNSATKNILKKILPLNEIEKYEKRYEYADIEKKNLLRQFSLENKKILRKRKNMKTQMEKNEQKFKINEAKNDKLNIQLEFKEKEYKKFKNKLIKLKKDLNDKKRKIKIMNEENILMSQKYQGIRDKYVDNNEKNKEKEKENDKDKDKDKENEDDEEEGEEEEDDND